MGRGVIRVRYGHCVNGFKLHIGTTTNNIAELWAVRYGLNLAGQLV